MKTNIIISIIVMLGAIGTIGAQVSTDMGMDKALFFPSPDSLINAVLVNNKTLQAAREQCQVTIMEARTGITPPDPQLEMGYLFGKPAETGNRLDFSVTQKIDFPTAYVHKSRLKNTKSIKAGLNFVITRQEILLQAKQLWIERIYLNIQAKMISQRLEDAEKMHDHYRQKLSSGEVGQLAFSQSNLLVVALRSEYEQVLSGIRSNQLSLNEICGETAIMITETNFPPSAMIIADSILQTYYISPELQLYSLDLELKEKEISLTISNHLPKLSGGYYSETVLDQQFKGFLVGITVPLWENANELKQAKSEVLFAEADAARFASIQHKEIMQKLDQLESLKKQVENLEEALGMVNDQELLKIALDMGEISLSEYIYGSDFYFRNVQSWYKFKRDQLLLEADLMKVYL